jgi:hypothetical protein
MTGNPFSTAGTATVSGQTCATSVKTYKQWYNPCAFTNPWDPTGSAHPIAAGTYVTDTASALGYAGGRRNQIPGPGFERVNTSVFKSFKTFHEQAMDFRADIFNLFNTKALANPSNTGIAGSNPGQISGLRSLGTYQPNSRFIQLSLRYAF